MGFVTEHVESRRVTTGENASAEFRYHVHGVPDDQERIARGLLEAASPINYDIYNDGTAILYRSNITLEPLGGQLWEGTVNYVPAVYSKPEGESEFAFDISSETVHVTQSLQTIARYAPPGETAPDFKGAIGVGADGQPEGVDILFPVYQFVETHYFNPFAISGAYKATLFSLTGRVNNASFRGFAAGEVRFDGASGQVRSSTPFGITYRFSASPNVTDMTIGTIEGINKKGWEYLWVRHKMVVDEASKALVAVPISVHVEQVYPLGDFSLLGIGA